MKEEHCQLSREAHECADSIPQLNNMVTGVKALGKFEQCQPIVNWFFAGLFLCICMAHGIALQLHNVKISRQSTVKSKQRERNCITKFRRLKACPLSLSFSPQ